MWNELPPTKLKITEMKIAYVTMVFPARQETFACLDVRTLLRAGLSVTVYCLRSVGPRGMYGPLALFGSRARERAACEMLRERDLDDLPVSHNTAAAVIRGVWQGLRHPSILLHLCAWSVRHNWNVPIHLLKTLALLPRSLDIFFTLKRSPPDIVHLFWGHYPAIVGHLIQRYLPGSVLSIFLGAYDLRRRYPGSALVARTADVVWTHAQANIPEIRHLGVEPDRIRVAYRGIDVNRFKPDSVSKIAHRIVTAGRLSAAKGMMEVLTTFRRLRELWADASLVVLGDGPDRERLRAAANSDSLLEAVRFQGHVPHYTVAKEMACAEVFLFMSKWERLPNVVKEAMASECVCVVTRTPGIDELVLDGISGYVVPQGDITGAVRRICEVFRNPGAARAMRARARRHVVERFDVTDSMRTYHEHWLHLVAQKNESRMLSATLRPAAGEGSTSGV
jgi:glycosyltransferase involved in cell wall biosynthesis